MGKFLSIVKTLAIPAIIAIVCFLLSTHVIVPFYRRYHARYAQYLPLNTLSNSTQSLRGCIMRWIIARHQRLMVARGRGGGDNADVDDDGLSSDEDGEELAVVDSRPVDAPRRGGAADDSTTRLSRDLEEGFRDDSDDDYGDDRIIRR